MQKRSLSPDHSPPAPGPLLPARPPWPTLPAQPASPVPSPAVHAALHTLRDRRYSTVQYRPAPARCLCLRLSLRPPSPPRHTSSSVCRCAAPACRDTTDVGRLCVAPLRPLLGLPACLVARLQAQDRRPTDSLAATDARSQCPRLPLPACCLLSQQPSAATATRVRNRRQAMSAFVCAATRGAWAADKEGASSSSSRGGDKTTQ